jgi:hypothetical protein
MLSGMDYPSGENYPVGTGMELFFTRMRVRVTRRVKFYRCRYEWALLVGYVPVAISSDNPIVALSSLIIAISPLIPIFIGKCVVMLRHAY